MLRPGPRNLITDVDGILVGNAEDRAVRSGTTVLLLDPPAFVKSRKDLKIGAQGYRKLVRLAAPLVARGGFFFVASCSHLVDVATFGEQVRRGLRDAQRNGRILLTSGAALDHPVHPSLPETAYLKALILQLD